MMIQNTKTKYPIAVVIIAAFLVAGGYWWWQSQRLLSAEGLRAALNTLENEIVDSPIPPFIIPELGFGVPLEIGSLDLNLAPRMSFKDTIKVKAPEINTISN